MVLGLQQTTVRAVISNKRKRGTVVNFLRSGWATSNSTSTTHQERPSRISKDLQDSLDYTIPPLETGKKNGWQKQLLTKRNVGEEHWRL